MSYRLGERPSPLEMSDGATGRPITGHADYNTIGANRWRENFGDLDSRRSRSAGSQGGDTYLQPLAHVPMAPNPVSPRDFLRTPPREALALLRKHGVTTKKTPGGTITLQPLNTGDGNNDATRHRRYDKPDRRSHQYRDDGNDASYSYSSEEHRDAGGRRDPRDRRDRVRGRGRDRRGGGRRGRGRYSDDYYDYYDDSYYYSSYSSRGRHGRRGYNRHGRDYRRYTGKHHRYQRRGHGGHRRRRNRRRHYGGAGKRGNGQYGTEGRWGKEYIEDQRGQDPDAQHELPLTVYDEKKSEEHSAARTIQANFRGYRARKALSTPQARQHQLVRRGAYHFTDDLINEIVREDILPEIIDDLVFNNPDEYRPFSQNTRDLVLTYAEIENSVVRELAQGVAHQVLGDVVNNHLEQRDDELQGLGSHSSKHFSSRRARNSLELVVEDVVAALLADEVPKIARECVTDNVNDYLLEKEVEAIYEDILQEAMHPLLRNTALRAREDHLLTTIVEDIVEKELLSFIRVLAVTAYREEKFGMDQEKRALMESDTGVLMNQLTENIALRALLHGVATRHNTAVTIEYAERMLYSAMADTVIRHHLDFARNRDRVKENAVASTLHSEYTHAIGLDSLTAELQHFSPHVNNSIFKDELKNAYAFLKEEKEKRRADLTDIRRTRVYSKYADAQVSLNTLLVPKDAKGHIGQALQSVGPSGNTGNTTSSSTTTTPAANTVVYSQGASSTVLSNGRQGSVTINNTGEKRRRRKTKNP